MSEYYHTKYINLLRWPSELECNRITTYTLANCGFCRCQCNTVHHWMSELTLYQQWTHGDKILPNSRKLMLCLTFLPLAYYFAELSYLIFMCTSTQQWQLRFYLWPCLFFFTSLVFETFTILFPHETCIENIRTRRGEELKMLKTANTVSMFSSAFCMPGRRGSCCSLTVTSSLPTSLPTRAITQGLQTLEMCCARSIDSHVSCTQDTH